MNEVIEAITKIRSSIHEQEVWGLPEPLSDAMTKLAVRNAQLAEFISPLHHDYKQIELSHYRTYRENMTQGDAEVQAKQEALSTKKDYENAKYIYKSTENLISTIQSRLRVLAEQQRGNQ